MKTVTTYLTVLSLSWYALACAPPKSAEQQTEPSANVEQAKHPAIGDYQYLGYDKHGGKMVEGRLSITSVERRRIQAEESVQIKGNWQLNRVGNEEKIGEQTGSGELTGGIIDGEYYLDLNPNISDGNVILKGTIEGKRFHGTWSLKGYAGEINHGTFEATRK